MEREAKLPGKSHSLSCVLLAHLLGLVSGTIAGLGIQFSSRAGVDGLICATALLPGAAFGLIVLFPLARRIDPGGVGRAVLAGFAACMVAAATAGLFHFSPFAPAGPVAAATLIGVLWKRRAWHQRNVIVWVFIAGVYAQFLFVIQRWGWAGGFVVSLALAQASAAGPLGLVLARVLSAEDARRLQHLDGAEADHV